MELPENEIEHVDILEVHGENRREIEEELYMEKVDDWFVI